jgi:Domain of unknown function (DUF4404)
MNKVELHQQLELLHEQLQQIDSVDERGQQLLQTLMSDIEKLINAAERDREDVSDRLGEGLKDGIELFEASHPQATMLMARVIDALHKMGI